MANDKETKPQSRSDSALTRPVNSQGLKRSYDLAPRKNDDGTPTGAIESVTVEESNRHIPPLGTTPDVAKAAGGRYVQTMRDRLLGTYVYAVVEDFTSRKLQKIDPTLSIGAPLKANNEDGLYHSPTTGETYEPGTKNGWVNKNLFTWAADILEASHDRILTTALKIAANIEPIAKRITLPSPKPRRRPAEIGRDAQEDMKERKERYQQVYSNQSLWDIKQNGWEYEFNGKSYNKSLDDYIENYVQRITFNQTEGSARGYGEQNIRVSTGFAMMGTADYMSRELFETGGRALSFLTASKEKKEEKVKEWKENGGIRGFMKQAAEEGIDHFFRGHLSDWNVGLFYVYAKEAYMRENGPMDTPEKYQHVMRRAFTVYNLYVELVHNTGYDYLKDLLNGESSGQYSQYKERHATEDSDLNMLQRSWNGLVDSIGFMTERGTQMFLTMQAAVTTFGRPRYAGIAKARELNQRAKLERGEIEGSDFVLAEFEQAQEIMGRASRQYEDARKEAKKQNLSGEDAWPNITDFLTPEEHALVKKYKTDYGPTSPVGEAYDETFEAFARKVERFTQNPNSPVVQALGVLSGGEDKSHYVQRMMNDAFSAYSGYSHYIANKRAGMMIAQDSNLLRQATNTATFGLLDRIKFGKAIRDEHQRPAALESQLEEFSQAMQSMRNEQQAMRTEINQLRSSISQHNADQHMQTNPELYVSQQPSKLH